MYWLQFIFFKTNIIIFTCLWRILWIALCYAASTDAVLRDFVVADLAGELLLLGFSNLQDMLNFTKASLCEGCAPINLQIPDEPPKM